MTDPNEIQRQLETNNEPILVQLLLLWGVKPVVLKWMHDANSKSTYRTANSYVVII